MSESKKVNVVIIIGGPTRGRRFRPISLDLPKPLFPLAGKQMVLHHIESCQKELGERLGKIFLLGSYEPATFEVFIGDCKKQSLTVEYLHETEPMGTAGGLFYFKSHLLQNAKLLFVMHSDVCCGFPLKNMLEFHEKHDKKCTMAGTEVRKDEAQYYGQLVRDPETNLMEHYKEKPETYISSTINAGIYCFDESILIKPIKRTPSKTQLFDPNDYYQEHDKGDNSYDLSLDFDVIPPLVSQGEVYVFMYKDFWCAIKNAGVALQASKLYLQNYAKTNPTLLARGPCTIKGNVVIHASAKIHPSAMLGPNVSIGPNVTIGQGVRVVDAIILDSAVIKDRACVMHTVVCAECVVGQWCRLEGLPTTSFHPSSLSESGADRREGTTILGKGVSAKPETLVRNCIVMPHKSLKHNYFNEILL